MRRSLLVALPLALLSLPGDALSQPPAHEHGGQPPENLGHVHMVTTCAPGVAARFDRGLGLLHSFWFGAAIDEFSAVTATDPQCGMAYWGIALSHWGNPFAGTRTAQALAAGREASAKGMALTRPSARERAYLTAVAELYRDFETVDQRTRTLAYERAMATLSRDNPDDPEAAIFYALALSQTALLSDKTYQNQKAAGAILEPLFRKYPEHPGIAHYIIHAYDFPPLAPNALDAAKRYSTIAPSAPHALHMPSHTFTRVGYWQESIDTNIASAKAAARDHTVTEQLHAMDYQVYAYLQTGQDRAALALVTEAPSLGPGIATSPANAAPPVAGYFALAAIPARYALERGAWADAAGLEVHPTAFLFPDAMTHYARALGAARAGRPADAERDLAALAAIGEKLAGIDAYWAEQIGIQRRAAEAWVAFAEGRTADALPAMSAAAELEDKTEKSAISPGPLVPVRELYGDLLLEAGKPADALTAYQASMAREPRRFRGLSGAERAAAAAGRNDLAREYHAQLVALCPKADVPGRAELTGKRH